MIRRNAKGYRVGESHQKAKLTYHQVEQMRLMRDQGSTYQQIADAHACSYWTARDIADYRTRI
jgi:DNA-binding CsgD family transcriptional regulator